MNAPPDPKAFDARRELARQSPEIASEFYVRTGKFIDKCAEAEGYVLTLLDKYGAAPFAPPRAPLSRKVEALRKLIGAPSTASKQRKDVLGLLCQLTPLAELRSDFAHSTRSHGSINGSPAILLKNAGDRPSPLGDLRLVLTLESIDERYEELSAITNRLKQRASTEAG